jgi:hypothetical protein
MLGRRLRDAAGPTAAGWLPWFEQPGRAAKKMAREPFPVRAPLVFLSLRPGLRPRATVVYYLNSVPAVSAALSWAWVTPTRVIRVPSGSVMSVLLRPPATVACEVATIALFVVRFSP